MNRSGRQTFQYGRIEARMKLHVGDGFWPAFWMLSNNIGSVGRPTSSEQDIMEWVQTYGPSTTSSTIHRPRYSGGNGIGSRFTFPNAVSSTTAITTFIASFGRRTRCSSYRDNPAQPFFTVTPASIPSGGQWVYNQPFFLLLNFALGGGSFPGYTDGSTPSTGTMLVDYVRVYQSSSSINSGAWYSVTNQNSGSCVDDANWGTSNGSIVQQWACGSGQNNQDWQFTPTDSGYYKVTSRNAHWFGTSPAGREQPATE
jgi:beta-glucanase (GH16 family)